MLKETPHTIYYSMRSLPTSVDDILLKIPKGWEKIVRDLIDDLFALGWDGHLWQIKEKFGSLRFYIAEGISEIWNRIEEAEKESAATCQECGRPGRRYYAKGWMSTLCDEHKPENEFYL